MEGVALLLQAINESILCWTHRQVHPCTHPSRDGGAAHHLRDVGPASLVVLVPAHLFPVRDGLKHPAEEAVRSRIPVFFEGALLEVEDDVLVCLVSRDVDADQADVVRQEAPQRRHEHKRDHEDDQCDDVAAEEQRVQAHGEPHHPRDRGAGSGDLASQVPAHEERHVRAQPKVDGEENQKVLQVGFADAIVHPRAVVVEARNAPVADAAVLGPCRAIQAARLASPPGPVPGVRVQVAIRFVPRQVRWAIVFRNRAGVDEGRSRKGRQRNGNARREECHVRSGCQPNRAELGQHLHLDDVVHGCHQRDVKDLHQRIGLARNLLLNGLRGCMERK
mmetsp:Transcript_12156/g.30955  ORF Transcript_12156/g.30955 Transcript_12156/m.30955 type:complete len:334 (+) Transcript_12156:88-1089(+)